MTPEVRQRLQWIELYKTTQNAGLVCRRCGISRPTLRKWWRRYQAHGLSGLQSKSHRPHHSPARKTHALEIAWILELRRQHNLGARRIQNELRRRHDCHLALRTISKILSAHAVPPLRKPRRSAQVTRFSRALPGECVQLDTCKIRAGLYQYTAIDDCTRYLVVALFPHRTANFTLEFLDQVEEEMPFPIQRIQTDQGTEFTAYRVREALAERTIKWRPLRVAAPHLNGKVERVQQTALREFWALQESNLSLPVLQAALAEWQHDYNWHRIHGTLGRPPMERFFALLHDTPWSWSVQAVYDPLTEQKRLRDWELRNARRRKA